MARSPEGIERQKAQDRARYHANKEAHRARHARWLASLSPKQIEARKQRTRAYLKAWYAEHPNYMRNYNRLRRESGAAKAWRQANPEKVRRTGKRVMLKRKYGITLEEYESLLSRQGGVCAICRKPESLEMHGRLCYLAVDHDHDAGTVRGLLCNRCNLGLGALDDDVERMAVAIRYLSLPGQGGAATAPHVLLTGDDFGQHAPIGHHDLNL